MNEEVVITIILSLQFYQCTQILPATPQLCTIILCWLVFKKYLESLIRALAYEPFKPFLEELVW